MRLPAPLAALIEAGLVDAALRPLSRGMRPRVLLVRSEGALCVAKLEAAPGEASREAALLARLVAAGVRVPAPRGSDGGVLRMELVRTLEGAPAPRLSDATLSPEEARAAFEAVVREVARMLAAGVIHRDLTPRDVLLSAHGPTLVDLSGAVEAAADPEARHRLLRGLHAVRERCARFDPTLRETAYGEELWALHARRALTPDTRLTGRWHEEATRSPPRGRPAPTTARPWDTPPPPGRHPRPWAISHTPRETGVKPSPSKVEPARETGVKPAPAKVKPARETGVKPSAPGSRGPRPPGR